MKGISIILIILLTSCSAQWHLNKAVKKGAELETIVKTEHDTTWITDHFYQIDTIHNQHTIVKYVPETRWRTRIETRFDYKRFKDSLKYFERMYSDSLETALKQSRIENRTERKANNKSVRTLWLLVICGIIGIIALILIKYRPL